MIENPRQKILKEYSNYNSSLGLLPVAFKSLFPRLSQDINKPIGRWSAAENVAKKLKTNPLEILILDRPMSLLPERRKELIENPESLFGPNYKDFLAYTNKLTRNNGKDIRVNPNVFNTTIVGYLSENSESYRSIIEGKAQSYIRNNLPYSPEKSKHYDKVAKEIKEGILDAFREYVSNNYKGDKTYKENVSLLLGLAAIEILYVPSKPSLIPGEDNHRLLPLLNSGR